MKKICLLKLREEDLLRWACTACLYGMHCVWVGGWDSLVGLFPASGDGSRENYAWSKCLVAAISLSLHSWCNVHTDGLTHLCVAFLVVIVDW